jgi:anti-sigma regulatory factor (Ser/Thr protein kinase)
MTESIVTSVPTIRRQEWRLPTTASSVRSVRTGLRTFLDGSGMPLDDLDDLMLAACEAATNAIEHAQYSTQPYFDLVFEVHDGLVTIVVRDHGRWRVGPVGSFRGRGLMMMSSLADVTLSTSRQGTTVTLRTSIAATGSGDDRG